MNIYINSKIAGEGDGSMSNTQKIAPKGTGAFIPFVTLFDYIYLSILFKV